MAQVEQAFSEFITRAAGSKCSVELDGAELHVVLNYRCYGGVENEFVELLKFALNPIVDGGNYLIQLDPDTGDPDEASLPIFLGETGTDQQYAQKRFACDEMVKWLEPVVSPAHLAAITDLIFEDLPEVRYAMCSTVLKRPLQYIWKKLNIELVCMKGSHTHKCDCGNYQQSAV